MTRVEEAGTDPLIVLVTLHGPSDAAKIAARLTERFPDTMFIGVVSADDGDDVDTLLHGVRAVMREVIFTTTSSTQALDADALSWRALNDIGLGQDFVYQVPRLGDAIDYALGVLVAPRRNGWDGSALLVPGPVATINEARAHLRRTAAPRAAAALARLDPVMARLVAEHGAPRLTGRRTGNSRFEQLAESICYQQLAGQAAAAIWGRTRALVDGPFRPEAVLALGAERLRTAGLSGAKTASLLDLATKVDEGTVRLERIGRLTDDEVIEHLVTVRGIGRWTAEMFLIFTLGRLDIWPVGDLGVRAGYARAYRLADVPTAKELEPLGDRFRPFRTLAAWYCWRVAGTAQPT